MWPGEKSAGELDLEEVGGGCKADGDHDVCKDFVSEVPTWNAEGKDFRIGVSPAMLNIGLHW